MSGNGNAAPAAVGGSGRLAGKSVLITGAGSGLGRAQDSIDAVALAVRTYGRLDVLMCSAGVPEEGFGTLAFEEAGVLPDALAQDIT